MIRIKTRGEVKGSHKRGDEKWRDRRTKNSENLKPIRHFWAGPKRSGDASNGDRRVNKCVIQESSRCMD